MTALQIADPGTDPSSLGSARGTVSPGHLQRPGVIERCLVMFTLFIMFFGLPTTWFSTRAELLSGGSGTAITTLVTFVLVFLGAMRVLGSIDLIIAVFRAEPLLLFLMAYLSATVLWSVEPYETALWMSLLIAATVYAVYMFLRFDLRDVLQMVAMVGAVGGACSLSMVLLLPTYGITGTGTGQATGAWKGVYSQKNALGFAATLIIPSMLILDRASPRWRWLARLTLVIHSILLVGSESKTMLMATLTSVGLLFVYQGFRAKKTLRGAVILALLSSTAITVAFATANLGLVASWLKKDITLTGRTLLWESLLKPIGDHFIFGYGYNVAFVDPLGPLFETFAINSWGVSHAHNAGLQLMLDGGIIALATYLWMYGRGVGRAIEVTRRVPGALGVWPLTFMSTVLMISISEPGVTQGGPGWILLVLALLYARAYRDLPIIHDVKPRRRQGARDPQPSGSRLKLSP